MATYTKKEVIEYIQSKQLFATKMYRDLDKLIFDGVYDISVRDKDSQLPVHIIENQETYYRHLFFEINLSHKVLYAVGAKFNDRK